MKTFRGVLVLALGLSTLALLGCDKKYTLRVTNVTSDPVDVDVLEDGQFTAASTTVAPDGGKSTMVVKQGEDEVRSYTIKTENFSQKFSIEKRSPEKMYFHISPRGISGPFDKEAEVKEKWDHDVKVRVQQREKVE